jgi:RimJ/RimL family protein N-acetyltransferase
LTTQFADAVLSNEMHAADYIATFLPFDDRAKNWAVVQDGTAVGNVGLAAMEVRHQSAWASYWLASGARGRGYASRGLSAVASWAFDAGLFRLELGHRVNNPASCRVATAAGFLAEGIERQKLRYGEERFDVETHARLAIDPAPKITALPLHSGR